MRFSAIFIKEAILIMRDKRALFLTIIFPIFMLLLYSYGVTFDIKHIPVAFLDYSQSQSSRDLMQKLNASGYLDVRYIVSGYDEIEKLLLKSKIILAFIVPVDFEKKLKKGETASIQVIVNGSDANTGSVALGYQAGILASYGAELSTSNLRRRGLQPSALPGVSERSRMWYNPELKSTYAVVPGVIAVVTMLLGSLLTANSIVREKESGTIEMLISTPISPFELIMGKVAPYIIVALMDIILVMGLAYLGLKVPIKGSIVLLLGASFLYLICALGIGLWASAVANSVSTAQFIVAFAGLLPSILLSGFIFPIESMPKIVQIITFIVPARYFIAILRGIFLKGIGLNVLWPQMLFLLIFGTLLLFISARRFRKRLD